MRPAVGFVGLGSDEQQGERERVQPAGGGEDQPRDRGDGKYRPVALEIAGFGEVER